MPHGGTVLDKSFTDNLWWCLEVIHNRHPCQGCTGGSSDINVNDALAEKCQPCTVGSQEANNLCDHLAEKIIRS